MDPLYWLGFSGGFFAACAIWFFITAWHLRRERLRSEAEDLAWREPTQQEKAAREQAAWAGSTRFERQYTEPAPPPLTGIVQKELPPNRVSETWAEDQRRWHEWLHRVDPDRSKP